MRRDARIDANQPAIWCPLVATVLGVVISEWKQ